MSAVPVPGPPHWAARTGGVAGAGPAGYSVAEVLGLVGAAVAEHTPSQVWVTGEVVSLRRSRAGHLYLTLAEGPARLSCAALGRDAKAVAGVLAAAGVELAEGISLRALGALAVYPERGSVELRVVEVDPRVTIGNHELARRAAREALVADGQLHAQASLRLSAPPLRVGVVAPDGAGLGDLETLLGASRWAFGLRVVRSPAEGSAAPERVAAALRLAAVDVDVVVLARGGGSAVRLPYDTEVVARAVATCPVPVIAALGHSTDRSLADELAWRSVPTPSAAAALVESLVADADRHVVELGREVAVLARRLLDDAERHLDRVEVDIGRGLLRPAVALPRLPAVPAAPLNNTRWRQVALVAVATAFGALVALAVVLVVLR